MGAFRPLGTVRSDEPFGTKLVVDETAFSTTSANFVGHLVAWAAEELLR